MIAELRRIGVLPIMAWLFLFPVFFLALAVWTREVDRRVATRAVLAAAGPAAAPLDFDSHLRLRRTDRERIYKMRRLCGTTADGRAFGALLYRHQDGFHFEIRPHVVAVAPAADAAGAALLADCG